MDCPKVQLHDRLEYSEKGQALQRALDIDQALRAGITFTLEDVAADEYQLLKMIRSSRDKREAELAKGDSGGEGGNGR